MKKNKEEKKRKQLLLSLLLQQLCQLIERELSLLLHQLHRFHSSIDSYIKGYLCTDLIDDDSTAAEHHLLLE